MKSHSSLYPVILAGLLIPLFISCVKEVPKVVPAISIVTVSQITATTITSIEAITTDGGDAVINEGVCWSTNPNPTITDNKINNVASSSDFTTSITGLNPGTTYYVRAFAISSSGTSYSTQSTITTLAMAPVLTTVAVTNNTGTQATSGGIITSDGGAEVTARGVCWSTSQNPTTANSKTTNGTGIGTFASSITGLAANSIYYLRAYATNSSGTSYGNQLSLSTSAFADGSYVALQKATIGHGMDIVFMGDGYSVQDISSKKYENDIAQAYSNFFNIEPYKSYSAYFNVYMVYAISDASGISDLTTTVSTKFATKYTGTGNSTAMSVNLTTARTYASKAPLLDINNTVAIVIANSTRYGGTTYIHGGSSGLNTSICPLPTYYASFIIQHEAGGHGFGNLADEYVTDNTAIPLSQINELLSSQYYGTFMNVDTTGNLTRVLWNHFIGLPKYSYVNAYQGGDLYSLGVWRPEANSIMVNDVKYFNAPSRELIVKRIMKLAGITYSFTDFQAKDVMELTKAAILPMDKSLLLPPPVILK